MRVVPEGGSRKTHVTGTSSSTCAPAVFAVPLALTAPAMWYGSRPMAEPPQGIIMTKSGRFICFVVAISLVSRTEVAYGRGLANICLSEYIQL